MDKHAQPEHSEHKQHDAPSKSAPCNHDDYDTLAEKAQQADESKERYVRALAEFENSKKRLEREREEFTRYAAERMVKALLPIVDSLDQALRSVDKRTDADAIARGVALIHRQLLALLEKEGVKRIEAVGKPFDHDRHEAVQRVETDAAPENTVVEEIQVGYTMHGRVIRPSLVKVAVRPNASAATVQPGDSPPDEAAGSQRT